MNKKMGESNDKVVVICLTLLVLTTTTMSKPSRLVTNMIHRNSIHSPYYNPNSTKAELAHRARASSMSRLAYLSSRMSSATLHDNRARIAPDEDGTMFMTLINIGDPPFPQLLTIDTASNLLWVQCQPCANCLPQTLPVFDPANSSSYAALPCASPLCPARCGPDQICKFQQQYADSTTAHGVMATEKLTFQPLRYVTGVVFGCANDNYGHNGQASGVLGLGAGAISLVTHMGSKFSYCIGNIKDHGYSNSFLVVGDGFKFEGDVTKLEVVNQLYHLTVTGISIDTKSLDIDPKTFVRSAVTGRGGVIIDSGTTITYLASGAYEPLSKEVMGMLDGVLERVEDHYGYKQGVCYKGVMERDLIGFPVVTIHFEGGAEVGLDVWSLFMENGDDEFCMAVEESLMEDTSVIGIMAQQRYNIGYDIGGGHISFQRIDCDVY